MVAPTAGPTQTQTQTGVSAGAPTNVGGGGALEIEGALAVLFLTLVGRTTRASVRRKR